jgi:hypothetical protein
MSPVPTPYPTAGRGILWSFSVSWASEPRAGPGPPAPAEMGTPVSATVGACRESPREVGAATGAVYGIGSPGGGALGGAYVLGAPVGGA